MPKIICNIHTNYAMQYICHDNNAIFIPQNICNYYAGFKPDCLGLLQVINTQIPATARIKTPHYTRVYSF